MAQLDKQLLQSVLDLLANDPAVILEDYTTTPGKPAISEVTADYDYHLRLGTLGIVDVQACLADTDDWYDCRLVVQRQVKILLKSYCAELARELKSVEPAITAQNIEGRLTIDLVAQTVRDEHFYTCRHYSNQSFSIQGVPLAVS